MTNSSQTTPDASRRSFFGQLGAAAALGLTAGAVEVRSSGLAANISGKSGGGLPEPALFGPDEVDRAAQAFHIRERAALAERNAPLPQQLTNGDEQRYPNFIGNYSKCLPHNSTGEVDPSVYQQFVQACHQGTAAAFESLPLTGNAPLANPMSGAAFELEGADSHHTITAPPPALASQARANDAVEVYWMALCRDVAFSDYASNPVTQAASEELSSLAAFTGPRSNGAVNAQTLFRGFTPDNLAGPYLSQFLLRPVFFDTYPAATGQVNVFVPGIDYLTDQSSWLTVQNGQFPPPTANLIDSQARYIRNGRDLAAFVHQGGEVGPFIAAMSWLASVNAPLNPGNPYLTRKKQAPLITFGFAQFPWLLGEVYYRALKACWYHKWFVHRTLRPEEYGGLVHMTLTRQAAYPVHPDVLGSQAIARTYQRYDSYFLPQAYPEGCPPLATYPAGHATSAGAAATILKAAFDGTATFSSLGSQAGIVTASADGLSLVPYGGSDASQLTINGEINKLAAHIALGRNFAGIHWRSDDIEGLKLGEAFAISVLRDQKKLYQGEDFSGFTITKFDGETITI